MNILSQRDPRWSSVKLGSSNLDLGNYGCTTTCLSMINNKFGASCTPDEVATKLEWYTTSGLILWKSLNLKNTIFDYREYGLDLPRIKEYLKDPMKAVMLEVTLPKNTKHWLLANSEDLFHADEFYCEDPWTGKTVNNIAYGSVTGSAFFSKRVPALP